MKKYHILVIISSLKKNSDEIFPTEVLFIQNRNITSIFS
jgi:hypothetical protein